MESPRHHSFVASPLGFLEVGGVRRVALLPPVLPTEQNPTIPATLLAHFSARLANALNDADPTLAGDLLVAVANIKPIGDIA
jgi:hypothetical protein